MSRSTTQFSNASTVQRDLSQPDPEYISLDASMYQFEEWPMISTKEPRKHPVHATQPVYDFDIGYDIAELVEKVTDGEAHGRSIEIPK